MRAVPTIRNSYHEVTKDAEKRSTIKELRDLRVFVAR